MEDNIINIGEGVIYIRANHIKKMFSIARSTVDNWAKKGIITRHKIGGSVFYDKAEILRLKEVGVSGLV